MHSSNDRMAAPAPVINPYEPIGRSRWDPMFGDETLIALSNTMQAKGNLVRSRSRYLREAFGQTAFDAVAARLTDEPLSFLVSPPLANSWCSYKSLRELDV